jgi:hypothetical protein
MPHRRNLRHDQCRLSSIICVPTRTAAPGGGLFGAGIDHQRIDGLGAVFTGLQNVWHAGVAAWHHRMSDLLSLAALPELAPAADYPGASTMPRSVWLRGFGENAGYDSQSAADFHQNIAGAQGGIDDVTAGPLGGNAVIVGMLGGYVQSDLDLPIRRWGQPAQPCRPAHRLSWWSGWRLRQLSRTRLQPMRRSEVSPNFSKYLPRYIAKPVADPPPVLILSRRLLVFWPSFYSFLKCLLNFNPVHLGMRFPLALVFSEGIADSPWPNLYHVG